MGKNLAMLLDVLKVWSVYMVIYGLVAICMVSIVMIIYTKLTGDKSCNIKFLRKIMS